MSGRAHHPGLLAVLALCGGCGRIAYESVLDAGSPPPLDSGSLDATPTVEGGPSTDTGFASGVDSGPPGDAGPCTWSPFGDLVHLDALSSTDNETSPSITADGLELYFARGTFFRTDLTIWVAKRSDPSLPFDAPSPVTELYAGADQHPGVSNDGLEIFFERPAILYLAARARREDPFGAPEAIAGGGTDRASGPALLDDDLTLFLSGNDDAGNDRIEIWARPDRNGTFTLERIVSELDTPDAEGYPTVASDGLELFYTVSVGASVSIYTATRASAATGSTFGPRSVVAELNIGPISGDPELSTDGTTMYFATDGAGTLGGTDLWSATRTCVP